MGSPGNAPDAKPWTFLTSHARVLIEIARDPEARLRDIAAGIGITERAAQAIVSDLEEAGYITRTRVGRRNRYTVDSSRPFRHPADAGHCVNGLLTLFTDHDHDHGYRPDKPLTAPAPSGAAGADRGDTR